MKRIAIIQFNTHKFEPQIEEQLLKIADWYEFSAFLSETDKIFEMQDLKEHYEIVLEVK